MMKRKLGNKSGMFQSDIEENDIVQSQLLGQEVLVGFRKSELSDTHLDRDFPEAGNTE